MSRILISPLGRSPGAVSGVYFGLKDRGFSIDKVVVVGTSDPDVIAVSRNYLARLFNYLNVTYDPIHMPEQELRREKRSLMPYTNMMSLAVKNAKDEGAEAHVAVTGGRSGMGALAALSAQFYGATKLWHLWVPAEIEREGSIDRLGALVSPRDMLESPFINPTVWGEQAWDLVDLPFMDLSGLLPALDAYKRRGSQPELNTAMLKVFAETGVKSLAEIFPAGVTIEMAEQYLRLAENYKQASVPKEREAAMLEIGILLQRGGVVSNEDRQNILNLLNSNASIDDLLHLLRNDRTGFRNFFNKYKDEIQTVIALADLLVNSFLAWLAASNLIS